MAPGFAPRSFVPQINPLKVKHSSLLNKFRDLTLLNGDEDKNSIWEFKYWYLQSAYVRTQIGNCMG